MITTKRELMAKLSNDIPAIKDVSAQLMREVVESWVAQGFVKKYNGKLYLIKKGSGANRPWEKEGR
jgi:hypothetical protein